jgi:hypothetical protein
VLRLNAESVCGPKLKDDVRKQGFRFQHPQYHSNVLETEYVYETCGLIKYFHS